MAVAETCAAGSAPECVEVNGEFVAIDQAQFAPAEVTAAAPAVGQENAVDVTLSSDGAAVLAATSAEVAQAGDGARLAIRVGDDVLASVAVIEPLAGDHFVMALPDDVGVDQFVEAVARH